MKHENAAALVWTGAAIIVFDRIGLTAAGLVLIVGGVVTQFWNLYLSNQ